jgi:hypothetical protein
MGDCGIVTSWAADQIRQRVTAPTARWSWAAWLPPERW